ncbi:MAG: hypothetical protein U0694_05420 [Anaerolineae bacterium]
MFTRELRAVKLRDLPLLRRLTENGCVLNTELGLTRDVVTPNVSGVLLPKRGLYTFLVRVDGQPLVGQFRVRDEDTNAHIVFVAPRLEPDCGDTAWLHLLDAMAMEAGKRGAHTLTAEVDEQSMLFETLRISGFAIYARQEIWRREAGMLTPPGDALELDEMCSADMLSVQSLVTQTTPRMVQQIADFSMGGYVYRENGRIMGYVAISEGKYGVYVMPCLHPDTYKSVPAIIVAAAARANRADKVPVYVRVRRYQEWLENALTGLGFESWTQQAVMVRHIAAGIRHPAFAPLTHALDVKPASAGRVTESVMDLTQQE